MDPILNPYSPGAGHQPPELAGRDTLRQRVHIAIARIKAGRAAKSILMIGLRGVGKTVLLEQMRKDAEAQGAQTLRIEAPERRSLPSLLAPQLRVSLLKLSRVEAAKDLATRGLKALAGFVKGLKVTFNDIEVGLDVESEPGLADNGDLEGDLTTLLEQVGLAAQSANTALVMFIDEMQYLEENQLAALITALHRCSQLNLPVTLVGAGLPQLRGRTGNAKSYAERLFDFPVVGPLNRDESTQAIVIPAQAQDVHFEQAAIEAIIIKTQGYPYFIQEWGSHTWLEAQSSPITAADVHNASIIAIAALDESFFGVRFDRLTPSEKRYLRAMAELGPGPHRSGDIAEQLGKKSSALGLVRTSLINKGMIWSPNHGDNAFTVPLFDSFMRRAMPGDDWNSH
ncbi:ATP-binding protein [Erwinia mallotivora]|uniref:ATP-binding protein n=1 Tax=Erwinia mallotivora TaxID=69222 RepID=UPI0021BEBF7C|nr:ATP-binding protein [Erwinia mallotivora]